MNKKGIEFTFSRIIIWILVIAFLVWALFWLFGIGNNIDSIIEKFIS